MYGTPMKHILIVLFVMLVPYRMLAQGGVLTSDDYDEEVRRAEQFQFSEEYASLMIMPPKPIRMHFQLCLISIFLLFVIIGEVTIIVIVIFQSMACHCMIR